jgi:hypothetical protein
MSTARKDQLDVHRVVLNTMMTRDMKCHKCHIGALFTHSPTRKVVEQAQVLWCHRTKPAMLSSLHVATRISTAEFRV